MFNRVHNIIYVNPGLVKERDAAVMTTAIVVEAAAAAVVVVVIQR